MSAVFSDEERVKQRVEYLSKKSGVFPKFWDRPLTRKHAVFIVGGLAIAYALLAILG